MTGADDTSAPPPHDPAAVLDEMDARVVDLDRAAAAGGVDLGTDRDDDAPDHVERVPGSPEPPD